MFFKNVRSLWRLTYPDANPNLTNIYPDVVKVDWTFIIGTVLSLIALLFTYDSITGERERGTLRLMLVNSIPRHTILIGKFIGAFISVNIPFVIAVLTNLLVISTSSQVQFRATEWGRLGILCFIAVLYTCIFILVGILISARVPESALSLMILLLIWISVVVFLPSSLATIAGGDLPMHGDELRKRQKAIRTELNEDFRTLKQHSADIWPERANPPSQSTMWWSERVSKDALQNERLNQEYLAGHIAQVRRAHTIARISPVVILQHLFESFAGTGFERHQHFLENVRSYAREYREFVVDADMTDPQSPHLIGIREGMSEKSVSPEAIPKFKDALSLNRDINAAAMDLLLLMLFLGILLSGVYIAFVRAEV